MNSIIRGTRLSACKAFAIPPPLSASATRSVFRRHLSSREEQNGPHIESVISSTKSSTAKRIQNLLKKKKFRSECGQTIAEGPRMVFDLLQNPSTNPLVRQILVTQEDFDDWYGGTILDSYNPDHPFQVQLVTPEVIRSCSDTVTPQGIVAVVDTPSWETPTVLEQQKSQPLYLVLDGISDPGNMGTLLRSSLAVGVAGVILLPECCDVWNPKAVRGAMGASFQLRIHSVDSWESGLEFLTEKCEVEKVYVSTMKDERTTKSEAYYKVNWVEKPSALVIGSEGNGISDAVWESLTTSGNNTSTSSSSNPRRSPLALKPIHVPMNSALESLNAAVCGSVVLFEYFKQVEEAEDRSS
eukprot:Nitzschia sp. Nitz4//scaffold30_size153850//144603//145667//NITZ4_002802-RA/size153850-processed-gene-0.198-mRNA-1//1//CDS//3329547336//2015//frame0